MKKYLSIFFLITIFLFSSSKTFAQEQASGSSATFAPIVGGIKEDNRVEMLQKYLEKYNSPLAKFADRFVYEADLYHLPFELLPAISGVESTFGQQVPCINAWGWNIYGDHMFCFNSYPEAIHVISKTLREEYINTWGDGDVYQLGKHYASSPTWSDRVVYFMKDIDSFKSTFDTNTLPISL